MRLKFLPGTEFRVGLPPAIQDRAGGTIDPKLGTAARERSGGGGPPRATPLWQAPLHQAAARLGPPPRAGEKLRTAFFLAIASFQSRPTYSAPTIPHASIHYYPVTGETVASIRASLDAHRLRDPADGKAVDALTHWHMRWRWPANKAAGCNLAAATVNFTADVRLPRLTAARALDPALARQWQTYAQVLAEHEAVHVRYAYSRRKSILAAIREATCATANAAAERALATIVAHDHAYDAATSHGAAQGAHFP